MYEHLYIFAFQGCNTFQRKFLLGEFEAKMEVTDKNTGDINERWSDPSIITPTIQ